MLEPLRVAMAAAAPGLKEGLTDEQFESAELQPVLLKGHLFELGDALERGQWETYTSKTTKATYPGARSTTSRRRFSTAFMYLRILPAPAGGRVERELEEVDETCDEFIKAAHRALRGEDQQRTIRQALRTAPAFAKPSRLIGV